MGRLVGDEGGYKVTSTIQLELNRLGETKLGLAAWYRKFSTFYLEMKIFSDQPCNW